MATKLNETDIKIYKYILKKHPDGIRQNDLWKKLKTTSRVVSRSLKKLEKLGYVKRTPVIHNGRHTYFVVAIPKPLPTERKTRIRRVRINFKQYTDIPCMYCPYIDKQCYEGGFYDPRTCDWLTEWILENISKSRKRIRRK